MHIIPEPPRRKNFIKENVRSLRKMEQMFHTNNQSANDLKLPILKHKISHRRKSVGDSEFDKLAKGFKHLSTEEAISVGIDKLIKQKSSADNENRKRSAPIFSNKQAALKKLTRPANNAVSNRKNHAHRSSMNNKSETKSKLKAHSIGDISFDDLDPDTETSTNVRCRSQGVQTMDAKDMNNLYSEGVIRFLSVF